MKQIQLLSYTYPNHLKLLIKGVIYEYEASEYFCRKFVQCLDKGAQFNALNWFRRVSKLEGKYQLKDGGKQGEG